MTIAAGTRIGPYDVLAAIGAGGMGEVYRTRDTRLGREVAIKNPAGFLGNVVLSADGKTYAYTFRDDSSTLYVAEGLR